MVIRFLYIEFISDYQVLYKKHNTFHNKKQNKNNQEKKPKSQLNSENFTWQQQNQEKWLLKFQYTHISIHKCG